MRFGTVRTVVLATLVVTGALAGSARAANAPSTWPDAVERLSQERTQAVDCARLIKTHGNATQRADAAALYNQAKAEINGTINGLMTALELDQKPTGLSKWRDRLAGVEGKRTRLCAQATALRDSAGVKGGGWEFIGAVLDPLADVLIAVLTQWGERNAQRRETIKSQLMATLWPEFDKLPAGDNQ